MKVELYTDEIPSIFARFQHLVGDTHWRKRAANIMNEIRGNPFLRDLLFSENSIAFGLNMCSDLTRRYGQIPVHTADCRSVYPCMAFAAQVLSIIDMSSCNQAQQFIRRIHGAFKNPDDMRALQLELVAATHFIKRGNSVAWPEMDGTGTMDLLINDLGPSGLEVECKSISDDKGRKIHNRDACEFYRLLAPKINSYRSNLQVGLAIVLTVSGRLPTAYNDRKKLAEDVGRHILSGKSFIEVHGGNLRVSEFDLSLLGEISSSKNILITSDIVDNITQTTNRQALVMGCNSGGAIIFVVQSTDDDALLPYVFSTLANAANKQMSKSRASLFLVGLHGIEANSLVDLAQQDLDANQPPTALRQHVSNFLSSKSRDYVVGIGFISKTEWQSHDTGHVASGGSAYMFPKQESPYWSNNLANLFKV